MQESDRYNPFEYLREDKDVLKLINNLIKNTTPLGSVSTDAFWVKSEIALLQAIIYYLYYEAPKYEQNFSTVMDLLRSAEVKEAEEFESPLDKLFKELAIENSEHIAVKQYAIFKQASDKTAKSILISVGVRLAAFNTQDVAAITKTDTVDITMLGQDRTILYVVIPDQDDTFNFLVAMLFSQIFDSLYYLADFQYNGRLPVHVKFVMDEFSNIGQIPNFEKLVATMRSREISVSIILQNLAQLKALYKDI